jgi:hypothetical protein
MTDNKDPFAPLNGEELSKDLSNPDDCSEEKLEVVGPVPSDAEHDRDAAARLFGRRPDVVWRYHDKNRRLLYSVARWNQPDGEKTILPLCVVRYPGRRPEWVQALSGTSPFVSAEPSRRLAKRTGGDCRR